MDTELSFFLYLLWEDKPKTSKQSNKEAHKQIYSYSVFDDISSRWYVFDTISLENSYIRHFETIS